MEILRLFLFTSLLCACCGWRCWLVLAALGAATNVGWLATFPEWNEHFSLLSGVVTMALLFGFYLLEFGADKSPGAEKVIRKFSQWVRLVAAALVAFLAFFPVSIWLAIPGALAGAATGWTMTTRTLRLREKWILPRPLLRRVGFSLGEDVICWLVLWLAFAQLG
ncbi:MAG: DUF4126 family protein [Verrucomicrobiota bacterium]